MPELHKLRVRFVETVTKPGKHGDGGGLTLIVEPSTKADGSVNRRWAFIWRDGAKIRELGLGSAQEGRLKYLSLADARIKARELRDRIARGEDPRATAPTAAPMIFRQYADAYIAAHKAGWKNPKTDAQWRASLEAYVYPYIGDMELGAIETTTVLTVLRQGVSCGQEVRAFWDARPETASRVRNRIEAILDAAKAEGKIASPWENPARWRGNLKHLLPQRNKLSRGHHAALPYTELPGFMQRLRQREAVGARALEFCVLCAARTGEVRGATWDEIDLGEKTWTIPARRMKAGREHRVPLSERAVEILREVQKLGGEGFVFPGTVSAKRGKPMLSDGALERVLDRLEVKDRNGASATVHGFRSSFRDWAAELTHHSGEVIELALAHTIGNKVEAAYRRGDLFAKRRLLMADWAAYCAKGSSNVIPIRKPA